MPDKTNGRLTNTTNARPERHITTKPFKHPAYPNERCLYVTSNVPEYTPFHFLNKNHPSVHVHCEWDHHDVEELFHNLLTDDPRRWNPDDPHEKRRDKMMLTAFRNRFHKHLDIIDTDTNLPNVNVYLIVVDDQHSVEFYAREWGADIIKCAFRGGGDDETFDYFPDYVWQFAQYCAAFKLQELYDETIKAVMQTSYGDDDSEFTAPTL